MEIITVTLNPAVDKKLTLGEIAPGGTNRCVLERVDFSGKGVNAAKTLAALGLACRAAGFMGKGDAARFAETLAALGVFCDFTPISGEVRTNIKLLEDSGRETEINESGPVVKEAEISAFHENFAQSRGRGSVFVLSGSLPPGVPARIYAELIETARASGGRVVLDASGEALNFGVLAAPYAIKPNVAELERFLRDNQAVLPSFDGELKSDARIKEAARAVAGLGGVSLAAVSAGERGAYFVTKERAVKARAAGRLDVKGTIGAGDAMAAGVAAAIFKGLDLDETARLASACASAAVERDGTSAGAAAEIELMKPRIILEEI
ncbi:MAG: hexose kinase [Clostridiales bacterium]|jgi:1-phosphofructokinase|nr:hexose kinase [Clostridiales bacterium]